MFEKDEGIYQNNYKLVGYVCVTHVSMFFESSYKMSTCLVNIVGVTWMHNFI